MRVSRTGAERRALALGYHKRSMNALIVSRLPQRVAWARSALGLAYAVEEADNGLAALVRARAGGIDVVIADETTEPYGAFGLSRELKLLADAPAVIVLLDRAQDAWLARWSGADRWLLQPADPFELAAAAREVLKDRHAAAAAARPDTVGTAEPVAG